MLLPTEKEITTVSDLTKHICVREEMFYWSPTEYGVVPFCPVDGFQTKDIMKQKNHVNKSQEKRYNNPLVFNFFLSLLKFIRQLFGVSDMLNFPKLS